MLPQNAIILNWNKTADSASFSSNLNKLEVTKRNYSWLTISFFSSKRHEGKNVGTEAANQTSCAFIDKLKFVTAAKKLLP